MELALVAVVAAAAKAKAVFAAEAMGGNGCSVSTIHCPVVHCPMSMAIHPPPPRRRRSDVAVLPVMVLTGVLAAGGHTAAVFPHCRNTAPLDLTPFVPRPSTAARERSECFGRLRLTPTFYLRYM